MGYGTTQGTAEGGFNHEGAKTRRLLGSAGGTAEHAENAEGEDGVARRLMGSGEKLKVETGMRWGNLLRASRAPASFCELRGT